MRTRLSEGNLLAISLLGLVLLATKQASADESQTPTAFPVYRSPISVVSASDGKRLFVADRTSAKVVVLGVEERNKLDEIDVSGQPRGLALSPEGDRLYVAQRGAGTVAIIDTTKNQIVDQLAVGRWPIAVGLAPKTNRLYVCNEDSDSLSVVDLNLSPPRESTRIPMVRAPGGIAVTPDERFVVVVNQLPLGVATDPTLSAEVTIVDADHLSVSASIKLPPGSTGLRGCCVSPDGKWAYVVHQLGRFNLPVTQLERGWVNTYALSVIEIAQGRRLATMLLDDLSQGAADPYAVTCTRDGERLWIAHAGVGEVSRVEIGKIHRLLEGDLPEDLATLKDGTLDNIWVRIQKNPEEIKELENDLTALYIAGTIRRFKTGGEGPRALALSPDERQLYVANYFSGAIAVLDGQKGDLLHEIPLGVQPEADAVRRGEIIFHDASYAFQRWHGCASCHHSDARVDGLRWDFLRDGIGNPKDTPSLIYVDKTEPLNRLATRLTVEQCSETSILVSHMIVPTQQEVDDLSAYLTTRRPEPSPHLTAAGELTEAAQRGKALFEGKADCAGCHPKPYFTDKKMHNVGFTTANDPDGGYDTPTLIEAYRTAPYLHDGRALTIKDALLSTDEQKTHGDATQLTDQELEDLVEYVLSL